MSDESKGWIGVDLDGTLAEYFGWVSESHIGRPIPAMIERVNTWLTEGKDVRIFTARVWRPFEEQGTWSPQFYERIRAIEDWSQTHLGKVLPITCEKDHSMIELWDDRCVQIERNTGRRIDGKDQKPRAWWDRFLCWCGLHTWDQPGGHCLGCGKHDDFFDFGAPDGNL